MYGENVGVEGTPVVVLPVITDVGAKVGTLVVLSVGKLVKGVQKLVGGVS